MNLKAVFFVFCGLIAGCAPLSDEAKAVKLVDGSQIQSLAKCRFIDKITASKGFKFGSPSLSDRDRLVNGLKNQAADRKANVILSNVNVSNGYTVGLGDDPQARGKVYSCPGDTYAKLIDVSDI